MKKILFVCVENSCRSQMAEAWARALGQGILEPYSAGSKPSGEVNPDAVLAMKKAGIDISGQRSKGFNDLPVGRFDYVVTMGCQDVCPVVPAEKSASWDIPDPKGKDQVFFDQVRDQIRQKIDELIREILQSG